MIEKAWVINKDKTDICEVSYNEETGYFLNGKETYSHSEIVAFTEFEALDELEKIFVDRSSAAYEEMKYADMKRLQIQERIAKLASQETEEDKREWERELERERRIKEQEGPANNYGAGWGNEEFLGEYYD